MPEKLVYHSRDLQRFDKPVAPVFIFGSFLGVLALTDQRLLFLSSGGAGLGNALAGAMLGVLTPEALRSFDAAVDAPGGLSIPLERIVAIGGYRRWDFGRYLRIDYLDADGHGCQTSLIPRGMAGTGWIDEVVEAVEEQREQAAG